MPTPAPIVVEASGKFLGDDGAWSTFHINVGNPPTQLSVLASTEIPETWVVGPEGCVTTDPSNCTQARGGTYNGDNSTTWKTINNYSLGAESNLGLTQNSDNGQYGFDTLAVAVPGGGNVSLDHQLIARLATKDFYLGNLGLANRQLLLGGDRESGFLSHINASNLIPSLSYGYTAGASYLPSNASLTLGGVDASRFTPNNVTVTFGTDPLRSKLVALQSIVATDSNSETRLLDGPILALVDSTVPHIWLPDECCQAFEKAFGITEDIASGLYLINGTTHDALIKSNPSISFQLSNTLTGGPAVNITLPYASFDLTIAANAAPLVKSPTRYFPLRRATSDTQYTLGRTLLQESYLIVNYESNNFSISQSRYSKDSPSQIVPIQHVQSQTTTSSPTTSPTSTGSSALPPITTTSATSTPSHSLGTPAIAGIAVAVVLLVVIAGAIGVWFRIKRKRASRPLPPELAADPTFPRDKAELENGENRLLSGSAHDKKGPRTSVESVSDEKQTQMDNQEIGLMDQGNSGFLGSRIEMGGSEVLPPSELPSPDPFIGHELSSSEAERMRSELSTPEPWAAEMPSPGMISAEMPSPEIGGTTAGERSPPRGASPSPLSSPEWAYPPHRSHSRRPVHGSMDSSESEGGWTRDGMAPASTRHAHHSRTYMAEPSDMRQQPGGAPDRVPSSASARQRPQHSRADSTDSETTLPTATIRSIRPTQAHVRVDSTDSEAFSTPPQRRPSLQPSRPPHRRLESKDSAETVQTRLEQSPPDSSFFPSATRLARDRPVEAIPSPGPQSSQEALVSPSATSIRSGLRSPEPWERGLLEEDEDKADNSEPKRREER